MVYVYVFVVSMISIIASVAFRKYHAGAARDYMVTALILVTVGCVMTLIVCSSCHDSISQFVRVSTFFSIMWIALWLGNSFSADWLSERISWTEEPVKMFFILLGFTVVYTLGTVYVILMFYRHVLGFNVQANEIIYSSLVITFLISMFMHGRSFLLGWRQSAIDTEKLKREGMSARYESLKNQVNPHFLFNSLNALTNLVYENQEMAVKFIKQLSEVYRYVLDTRDRELVSEQEELKFLDSYVFLQRIRFGQNLSITIDMKGEPTSFPPLVLQMLIENAVKHNEVSADHPLVIRIFKQDGYVVVENALRLKTSTNPESQGVGLSNIMNRYEFLSNRKIEVLKQEGKFIVKLPILRQET